jgi:hypothetical protein
MPVGANVDLGLYYRIEGLSAGALNDNLVPEIDVSNYKWITIGIGSDVYVGSLVFERAMDASGPWQPILMYSMDTLSGLDGDGSSTSDSGIVVGTSIWFPYFRVRMQSYTSGTATGTAILYRDGLPGFNSLTFGSVANPSNEYAGYINNDGNKNVAIASGHAADTIVSAVPGMLARVLVTAQNTHQMTIYDNDTAPSGTIIGIIPANQAVDGKPFVCKAPAANGICVEGNSNNPGVTIFYT